MSFYEMAILGIIQGITEFLPISSSGHLVIAQDLLDINAGSQEYYILLLHLATLAAVVLYFWNDIVKIAKTMAKKSDEDITFKNVVIGTIPAVIISLLFESTIDKAFSSTKAVILLLACTGIILCIAQKWGTSVKNRISDKDSFSIGWFQALAILPGISRSGSTLSGGMLLGIKAETALRFSFILSIPAIIGAVVFKLDSLMQIPFSNISSIAIGMIFAFISALISIKLLFRIVAENRLYLFSIYCWVIASIAYLYMI